MVFGQPLTFADVRAMAPPKADHRILYGPHPLQFGDLRLPDGPGPHPVAVILHGGCWLASINLDNIAMLSAALARDGIATFSLEYRRVGDGGGWPTTFDDVLAGFDKLESVAGRFQLDPGRVVLLGHSAGGHLALWVGAKRKQKLRGVVSLAGVTDLRKGAETKLCGDAIPRLVPGTEIYARTSPAEMLPLGIRQILIEGAKDTIVPPATGAAYLPLATKAGDTVERVLLEDAGHFELIVPGTPAYGSVLAAARKLLAK